MSTLFIMGAMVLLTASFEAVKPRPKIKIYRKPDAKRHKKSPHTYHSREL